MIKTVIIDDDILTHKVINSYINKLNDVEVVESFSSPVEGIKFLNDNSIDIIFLDVEMPDFDGFDLMDMLKCKSSIVLISSEQDYALKAFSYNVFDYLHKPIQFQRFYNTIDKYKETLLKVTEPVIVSETIFVKVNRQLTKVDCNTIISITSNGDYMKILLEDNSKLHVYGTLTNFSKVIPVFLVRVHRKHIININKIEQMNEAGAYLKQVYYPIGKTYIEELKKQLNIF